MNRNSESRFSIAPQVSIERSTFNRDSTVKTSFNVGQVIPFYLEEVLPGDTFSIKTSMIARMQTLKTPMMDDVFLDKYYFFVPNRLVWTHWRNFMGENSDSAWIPSAEYSVPQITSPSSTGWNVGTIADYLGIRPGIENLSVNALPFRAYALICQEWFRDENLMDPLVIETGDSTVAGSNGDTYTTDVQKGGMPFIAAKTHDYFTSCLPSPQKGPDVQIPVGQAGQLPVYTVPLANAHYWDGTWSYDEAQTNFQNTMKKAIPLLFSDVSAKFGDPYSTQTWPSPFGLAHTNLKNTSSSASDHYSAWTKIEMPTLLAPETDWAAGVPIYGKTYKQAYNLGDIYNNLSTAGNTSYRPVVPINLVAGTTGEIGMASINELRLAFQIQRFYEKCARGGTRYIELLKSHFGVTSPDARMQRPEYLGGNRLPLNIRQITQTSSTTEDSPMGDVAGMSVTTDNNYDFTKSFTEHGYIIGVCVARYNHTYQQGIDRTFFRKSIFDYYWPVFAHIGEQAVKCREIFAQGTNADNLVFGYQEAWAEYRYKPNRVTGMMRSDANTALDTWHLGDDYESRPSLSADWIREDKANLDRVLTVTSSNANQIFADIYVQNKSTRPMPLYSIPGLIDHF